jgi:hypothetical protein
MIICTTIFSLEDTKVCGVSSADCSMTLVQIFKAFLKVVHPVESTLEGVRNRSTLGF